MPDLLVQILPRGSPSPGLMERQKELPKTGSAQPELPCLERDFPATTWAQKGEELAFKGKTAHQGPARKK